MINFDETTAEMAENRGIFMHTHTHTHSRSTDVKRTTHVQLSIDFPFYFKTFHDLLRTITRQTKHKILPQTRDSLILLGLIVVCFRCGCMRLFCTHTDARTQLFNCFWFGLSRSAAIPFSFRASFNLVAQMKNAIQLAQ